MRFVLTSTANTGALSCLVQTWSKGGGCALFSRPPPTLVPCPAWSRPGVREVDALCSHVHRQPWCPVTQALVHSRSPCDCAPGLGELLLRSLATRSPFVLGLAPKPRVPAGRKDSRPFEAPSPEMLFQVAPHSLVSFSLGELAPSIWRNQRDPGAGLLSTTFQLICCSSCPDSATPPGFQAKGNTLTLPEASQPVFTLSEPAGIMLAPT